MGVRHLPILGDVVQYITKREKMEEIKMAKLKKPLPEFKTEEEEAEYWDSHSPLEHFDESDFKPLQARVPKDTPITIRLDSESRQALEEVAQAYKVGPSTLARMLIVNALQQWKAKRQLSLTLEDARLQSDEQEKGQAVQV